MKLVDRTTSQASPIFQISTEASPIIVNDLKGLPIKAQDVLKLFPRLIRPRTGSCSVENKKVFHRIDTGDANPTFCKRRQLAPDKKRSLQRKNSRN